MGQTFSAASVQLPKEGAATMAPKGSPKELKAAQEDTAEEDTAAGCLAPSPSSSAAAQNEEEDDDDDAADDEFELAPAGCTQIYNASGCVWSRSDGLRDTYRRSVRTGKLVYYGGPVVTARKSTGGPAPRR